METGNDRGDDIEVQGEPSRSYRGEAEQKDSSIGEDTRDKKEESATLIIKGNWSCSRTFEMEWDIVP